MHNLIQLTSVLTAEDFISQQVVLMQTHLHLVLMPIEYMYNLPKKKVIKWQKHILQQKLQLQKSEIM